MQLRGGVCAREGRAGWPWYAQRQGRVALYSGTDELVLFDGALHCSAGRSKRRGGCAWGHLVWQGHYLGARQPEGKSVDLAGTHPRIPGNHAADQGLGRQVGNREDRWTPGNHPAA